MSKKIKELRGLIYGKYDSESEFAKILGWERQKLSKITNGLQEPNIRELNEMAELLDITVEELAQIFLRRKSPNRQQNTGDLSLLDAKGREAQCR